MGRRYSYSISVMAGCFECWGTDAHWFSANSQAVAAKHHDKTGHTTWVDSTMSIRYGKDVKISELPERSAKESAGFVR